MNKLYFDVVTKISVKEAGYFGFTANGWHFSKKSHSTYPVKIITEKITGVAASTDLPDINLLQILKKSPPQVGDYIIFKPAAKGNSVVTWCHSTLFLRKIFYAIKKNELLGTSYSSNLGEDEPAHIVDEYLGLILPKSSTIENDYEII